MIDKEGNGLPEVDFSRRTTKVNLAMIIGIGLFFLVTAGVVFLLAARA